MHLDGHFATSQFLSSVASAAVLIHFHILFLVRKHDQDRHEDCLQLESVLFKEVLAEWKRNVAPPIWSPKRKKFIPNSRHPVYRPLCTYVRKMVRGKLRSNYDLHYVNPTLSSGGSADVCFYVLKYMMKPSERSVRLQQALHLNLSEEEYEDIWSLVRPRHFESDALGYGVSDTETSEDMKAYHVVLEHLRKGIEQSKYRKIPGQDPMPLFILPSDGSTAPLAKYYKSNPNVFDMQDFLSFFYASSKAYNEIDAKQRSHTQWVKAIDDFNEKSKNVLFQQTADELDELFDDDLDSLSID